MDKDTFQKWLGSDKRVRVRDFGPAAVRRKIEKADLKLPYVEADWYSEFCERFTHVTPETKPNMHNAEQLPFTGAVFQEDGLKAGLAQLATITVHVALLVARYEDFDDLYDELVNSVMDLSDDS